MNEDIITGYPIAFISGETERLLIKYSLLVKQYSISRNTYLYWNKLKTTNQEIGSLYDPVPSFLPGNIRCTTRENEIVLGYFQASGMNKKRIFVGFDEIPPMRINKGFEYCDYAMVPNDSALMAPYINDDWILIGIWSMPWGGGYMEVAHFVNSAACIDCSYTGDPEKPDYWID